MIIHLFRALRLASPSKCQEKVSPAGRHVAASGICAHALVACALAAFSPTPDFPEIEEAKALLRDTSFGSGPHMEDHNWASV
jgi:hypothetical protein